MGRKLKYKTEKEKIDAKRKWRLDYYYKNKEEICKNYMKKRIYKIYSLICPIKKEPRYIGYTYKNLRKRLVEHCNPSKLKPNTHKNNWIKGVFKIDKPSIELIEDGIQSLECALEREILYIKKYKELGYDLTNSTDGGEGHLNHSQSLESIAKTIETKRRNGTLKHSSDTVEKIRLSKIGKPAFPGVIEKLAIINRKEILQIDLGGNIVNKWSGIRIASRFYNISHCGILRCIDKDKPYKGFIWKYYHSSPKLESI